MASMKRRARSPAPRLEMFAAAAPMCPKCAGPMTPRTAKRPGAEPHAFWGCAAFPACLGTRPLR